MSVVLPAPFGPISACTSPARDVEADAVDGDHAAEALTDVFERKHRLIPRGANSTTASRMMPTGSCQCSE